MKNITFTVRVLVTVSVFALASSLSFAAERQPPGPVVLDRLLQADSETAGLLKAAAE